MESQDSQYRRAMIYMKRFKDKNTAPEICFQCIAWKHFGGCDAEDVTKGPMCVCNDNWKQVQKYIKYFNDKKLLAI